jgi:protein-tyrosine kinase
MSRIHEALKRAEQEKTAKLSTAEPPEPLIATADIRGSMISSAPVAEDHADVPNPSTPLNDSSLRYEGLMKRCAQADWKSYSTLKLLGSGDNGKVGAERFRTLRSRLYQMASLRPLRRVLITSSLPGEGKTFIAINLAQSIMGQADRRVLLLDADLRAPRLHDALGAPSTPGLADYLRGEADEYRIIQRGRDTNLCFVPCGNRVSNPSELLLNARMKTLLDRVTPAFDWVIVDSPPVLPVHDAYSLADLCDAVLFVVEAGKTNYESAKKAASEFKKNNLLGVVLNRVEDKDASYGSYYYGGYGHEVMRSQRTGVLQLT